MSQLHGTKGGREGKNNIYISYKGRRHVILVELHQNSSSMHDLTSGQRPLASSTGYYTDFMVTFYEDDLLPFLKKSLL